MLAAYKVIQSEFKTARWLCSENLQDCPRLEQLGSKPRVAPNRIDAGARKNPCPEEKRGAIIEALRKLGGRDDDNSR